MVDVREVRVQRETWILSCPMHDCKLCWRWALLPLGVNMNVKSHQSWTCVADCTCVILFITRHCRTCAPCSCVHQRASHTLVPEHVGPRSRHTGTVYHQYHILFCYSRFRCCLFSWRQCTRISSMISSIPVETRHSMEALIAVKQCMITSRHA